MGAVLEEHLECANGPAWSSTGSNENLLVCPYNTTAERSAPVCKQIYGCNSKCQMSSLKPYMTCGQVTCLFLMLSASPTEYGRVGILQAPSMKQGQSGWVLEACFFIIVALQMLCSCFFILLSKARITNFAPWLHSQNMPTLIPDDLLPEDSSPSFLRYVSHETRLPSSCHDQESQCWRCSTSFSIQLSTFPDTQESTIHLIFAGRGSWLTV